MDFDRENPFPLARLPGTVDANWHDCSPELETAYLQQLAGVERLEDATSLQLVVNTAAGGSVAHLGGTLPNLIELNLNGSTIDSLRDLGTGFQLLQVLWVSRCGLKALDGLNGLPSLRELYAAYNDITDLQPVDSCQHLEILDVECNCIPDTDAVLYLASCSNLQTLTLAGNPAAEKQGYRHYVCAVLPSLHFLDDEPVTAADCNPNHQQQQTGDPAGSRRGVGGSGTDGAGLKRSSIGGVPLPPPPLRAGAAAGRCSPSTAVPSSPGYSAGGATAAAVIPDAEEVAFVVAGIKHARVGVDSHEFREIEMNLLVATADGTDVQLDVRPGTSTLLPASASTWVRTLRSSREGSLAALRASAAAAAASAVARTGSQSPTSPCSASPISSRPPSSQQQRTSGQFIATAVATPTERWAVPAGPGGGYGLSSSYGGSGGMSAGLGPWRPSSGAGILTSSAGGAGGGLGGNMEGSMRPGSGGYRPGTGRPYSARPGTSASFSARLGTSASTGAAPSSTSVGLYWAKNRISGTSAAATGGGADGDDAAADADSTAYSSKLTLGSDTTFGGSFARDLRKWKGAAVRAAAAASAGGASINGTAAASLSGGNGLSSTLLRGGQLDPKALLEELKRWKLETADKVLFVDPDEAASNDGWATADAPDRATVLGGGGVAAGAIASSQADILRLTSSQDGASQELAAAISVGLGMALLDSQNGDLAAAAGAFSPMLPDSPLQPPRPPPGTAAAGRRKMVLAKVLRDIAADTIGNSGVCISDILAGLRPVHAPPKYGGAGGTHTPCVAWGAPDSSSSRGSREQEKSSGSASAASTLTAGKTHHDHLQNHHHNHRHHHPQQQQQQQQPHSKPSYGQQQQQQGVGQRPSSARSVCSSSGHSDNGTSGAGAQSSRPGSRDEATSSGGTGSAGGAPLQRQRSASRAPGLPTGPSAPASTAAFRGATVVREADVRLSNPGPVSRISGW
ncbi:hypothetical protein Vretimale_10809 [Volvox reticuliferus]|uniref:Uncharacterized protein n=1 Tax=Volvox reticuliferus TaxID=1737510 RepID=A0A8J4CKT2_9CHLO|nr:hypothetical protein Vretifemale_13783 [Volvox reticuliferus]GIM06506.1 hypothetical protein Vretimale_10809 [Volvox reticuliferus]